MPLNLNEIEMKYFDEMCRGMMNIEIIKAAAKPEAQLVEDIKQYVRRNTLERIKLDLDMCKQAYERLLKQEKELLQWLKAE